MTQQLLDKGISGGPCQSTRFPKYHISCVINRLFQHRHNIRTMVLPWLRKQMTTTLDDAWLCQGELSEGSERMTPMQWVRFLISFLCGDDTRWTVISLFLYFINAPYPIVGLIKWPVARLSEISARFSWTGSRRVMSDRVVWVTSVCVTACERLINHVTVSNLTICCHSVDSCRISK